MKNGLIINDFGNKFWYQNDLLHREDGPAAEYNGCKEWWQNGKLHRLDGPASQYSDGSKYWFYQGEFIRCSSQEEFEKFLRFKAFW